MYDTARTVVTAIALLLLAAPVGAAGAGWRTDPAWDAGRAEWAQYEAERVIYGAVRRYHATIFTNKQQMDASSTVKAADDARPAGRRIAVFKHNCSEIIPTDNYDYRFLTTCFVRADDLRPYKLVASSQEDCGSSYKQLVVDGGALDARQYGYFPGEGARHDRFALERAGAPLAMHDALSLTLRDYPFDASERPSLELSLVPDHTSNRLVPQRPAPARVRYVGLEQLDLPYGAVAAHHLQVTHDEIGGTTTSDYWFAADPALRHVMVQHEGPWGVRYRLARLDWWAYWSEPRP